jgi:hypothetical protein
MLVSWGGCYRDNPTASITWNAQPRSDRVLLAQDLPDWWARVQALPNPLLFSGLRPGTLVTLRREWIDLDARGISIPRERMKSRREFASPSPEPGGRCPTMCSERRETTSGPGVRRNARGVTSKLRLGRRRRRG